jgi:hypothetical protein
LLQRQIGNRAVADALRSSGDGTLRLLMLQRQAGNRAAALSLQRALEAGVAPALGEDQVGPQLEEVVVEQVGALPDVDAAAVPAPERVEEARDEAAGVRDELGELRLAAGGPMADWYRTKPGGTAPGRRRWSRSSGEPVVTSTCLRRRDLGAEGQAVAGLGAPVAGHIGDVASAGKYVIDNPATAGAAQLVDGSGAAERVHQAGEGAGRLLRHQGCPGRSFDGEHGAGHQGPQGCKARRGPCRSQP